MIIVGIDSGLDGAVVALDDRARLLDCRLTCNAFTARTGKGNRRDYLPAMMAEWLGASGAGLVVLEKQSARPGQGVSSSYRTGLGSGLWQGLAAGIGIGLALVSPMTWQRVVLRDAPGEGKARAVHVASRRVPALGLSPGRRSRPHDGLADACCLALYGIVVAASSPPRVARDNIALPF